MQHFEKRDRSRPPRSIRDVAEEFYAAITERVAQEERPHPHCRERTSGEPLGWAAACEDESEVYIHAEERTYGYIAELYVVEDVRGRGVGRALIAACEDWARERGLKAMMIGVLVAQRSGTCGLSRRGL